MSERRRFPNDAASVRDARRFVLDAVAGVPPGAADAIAVMVSELAANAVRHTVSHFTVAVDRLPDRIRVEVGDSGPGDPVVRMPAPAELSGRGLQIVRALAGDWGVIPAVGMQGKTVWFTIAVDPALDESQGIAGRLRQPVERRDSHVGEGRTSPSTRGGPGGPSNRASRARPYERQASRHCLRARLRSARCSPRNRAESSPATNALCD
jgi:anti-sigma regulatory factor (Ser/Thr protein kinase)